MLGLVRGARGWVFGALVVVACSPEERAPPERQVQEPIELGELGSVFRLTTSLSDVPGPLARSEELAALASGGLRVPFLDDQKQPWLVDADVQIGGSCGATLVSPSYALTASHCVSSIDGDLESITLDMFRPTLELGESFLKTTELAGSFPSYSHGQVGEADGYFIDRYACTVAAHCGDQFGAPVNCGASMSASADVAVVRCEGRPGDRYGYLEVASSDDLDAPLLMPWKHEIFDVPLDPEDDRFLHYSLLGGSLSDNYHYRMFDSDGAPQNQLFPLISVAFDDGSWPRKLSADSNNVLTDLVGCHGTSGSGALEQGPFGFWQLLGPARYGDAELSQYLCNHVPVLTGPAHAPGASGIAYGGLAATQYIVEQLRTEIDADCAAAGVGTSLYTHLGCWMQGLTASDAANAEFVQRLESPSAPSLLEPFADPVLTLSGTDSVDLVSFASAVPGSYRVGLSAWSNQGCESEPCPTLTLTLDGEEALVYEFAVASEQPVPLAAEVEVGAAGPHTLTLSSNASERLEVSAISLVPVVHVNHFDRASERLEVAMEEEPDGELGLGRFVGDGREGFEVRLLPGERLLLGRQALASGQLWSADFAVRGDSALRCALVDSSARVELEADCSTGTATLADPENIDEAHAAFSIENTGDGEVFLDDVELVSTPALDSDSDGVVDAQDDCPDAGVPDAERLAELSADPQVVQLCLPVPTLVDLEPPDLLLAERLRCPARRRPTQRAAGR